MDAADDREASRSMNSTTPTADGSSGEAVGAVLRPSAVADPEWERWRRRRLRVAWIYLVTAGLGLAGGTAFMYFSSLAWRRAYAIADEAGVEFGVVDSGFGAVGDQWTMGSILLAVATIAAMALFRCAFREWSLVRAVIATDGCVCPRCATVMRVDEGVSVPDHIDDRIVHCARCAASLRSGEARRYWEQTVVSPDWARRWRAERLPSRGWGGLPARVGRMARRRPVVWTTGWLLGAASVLLAIRLAAGQSLAGAATHGLPVLFLLIIGGWFVGRAIRRHESDDAPRCAKCGYQQSGDGNPSPRCPECGAEWTRIGGTTLGRSPAPTIAYAVLGVLLCGALCVVMAAPRLIYPIVPTSILVSMVGDSTAGDGRLATEFNRRTLDDHSKRRLVERLVELRADRRLFDRDLEALLENAFIANELIDSDPEASPSLRDRFVSASLRAEIVGPDSARRGDEVTLRIAGTPVQRPFGAIQVGYVWGGWEIDGGPARARGDGVEPGIGLWVSDLARRGRGAPSITLRPGSTGALVVGGDLWIVIDFAGVAPRRARWTTDGEPIIDDPPPLAVQRMRLNHLIEIDG